MAATNREHWDSVGGAYAREWEPPAKQQLSRRELDLIARGLEASSGRVALDVGIGSGRILAELLERSPGAAVYGLDVAPAMVDACERRFAGDDRVRGLRVCDVAREPLPFEGPFDFISAIRMLKYSRNWREVVAKLAGALAPGGVMAYSMPNRDSLNRLSRRYAVRWYASSAAELEELTADLGLELLELRGFTRLPYAAYNRPRSRAAARAVVGGDRALDRVLGRRLLARELFLLARRG